MKHKNHNRATEEVLEKQCNLKNRKIIYKYKNLELILVLSLWDAQKWAYNVFCL